MQFSIKNFSEINLGDRIDSEYFQPKYLRIEKALSRLASNKLKHYVSITGSAFYPAATHLYESGDLPFIRCVDCISYLAITTRQDKTFEKIPIEFADSYKNIKRLTKGDIVITKVGSPCFASIIHDIESVALSRTVLGLKEIKDINPYYLVVFLRAKYGFLQLLRARELTIQFQLTLDRVGDILIFKPTKNILEEYIARCFIIHLEKDHESVLLFTEAENILLAELGLNNWQPQHRLAFIKCYSETQAATRIDAEYFQPKYQEVVRAIKNYAGGWDTLGNLVTVKKCVEVGSGEYLEAGIPFVRVSNLSPFEITEEKYISEELYEEIKQHQPQPGEILFSKDATPGIAHYLNEAPRKMIPSGGILRLKRKSDQISNEYLTLVLNSVLTKEQVNRDVGGSIILHWRTDQVKATAIPLLPQSKQHQIQQKVIESFNLRQQSKQLLECAKRAVELAIEQDEQIAINWLQDQMHSINPETTTSV